MSYRYDKMLRKARTASIAKGSVTTDKIKDGAVTWAKMCNALHDGRHISVAGGTISELRLEDIVQVEGSTVTIAPDDILEWRVTEDSVLHVDPLLEDQTGMALIMIWPGDYEVAADGFIYMDALTPDAVNFCELRWFAGKCYLWRRHEHIGYLVTVAGGTEYGSLRYGISNIGDRYLMFTTAIRDFSLDNGSTVERDVDLIGNGALQTRIVTPLVTEKRLGLADITVDALTVLEQGDVHIGGSTVGEAAIQGGTMTVARGSHVGSADVSDSGVLLVDGGVVDEANVSISNDTMYVLSGLAVAGNLEAGGMTYVYGGTLAVPGGEAYDVSVYGGLLHAKGTASVEYPDITGGTVHLEGTAKITGDNPISNTLVVLDGGGKLATDGGTVSGGTIHMVNGGTLTARNALYDGVTIYGNTGTLAGSLGTQVFNDCQLLDVYGGSRSNITMSGGSIRGRFFEPVGLDVKNAYIEGSLRTVGGTLSVYNCKFDTNGVNYGDSPLRVLTPTAGWTVAGSLLVDNYATQGSGINLWNSNTGTISDCQLVGGVADNTSCAIYDRANSDVLVDRCVFKDNDASGGSYVKVIEGGTTTLQDCSFLTASETIRVNAGTIAMDGNYSKAGIANKGTVVLEGRNDINGTIQNIVSGTTSGNVILASGAVLESSDGTGVWDMGYGRTAYNYPITIKGYTLTNCLADDSSVYGLIAYGAGIDIRLEGCTIDCSSVWNCLCLWVSKGNIVLKNCTLGASQKAIATTATGTITLQGTITAQYIGFPENGTYAFSPYRICSDAVIDVSGYTDDKPVGAAMTIGDYWQDGTFVQGGTATFITSQGGTVVVSGKGTVVHKDGTHDFDCVPPGYLKCAWLESPGNSTVDTGVQLQATGGTITLLMQDAITGSYVYFMGNEHNIVSNKGFGVASTGNRAVYYNNGNIYSQLPSGSTADMTTVTTTLSISGGTTVMKVQVGTNTAVSSTATGTTQAGNIQLFGLDYSTQEKTRAGIRIQQFHYRVGLNVIANMVACVRESDMMPGYYDTRRGTFTAAAGFAYALDERDVFTLVVKPTASQLTYQFIPYWNAGGWCKVLDWGDGTATTAATSGTAVAHTYSAAGTYTIKIRGNCYRAQFGYNTWSAQAALVLDSNFNWSALGVLTNTEFMFDYCVNMGRIAALPKTATTVRASYRSVGRDIAVVASTNFRFPVNFDTIYYVREILENCHVPFTLEQLMEDAPDEYPLVTSLGYCFHRSRYSAARSGNLTQFMRHFPAVTDLASMIYQMDTAAYTLFNSDTRHPDSCDITIVLTARGTFSFTPYTDKGTWCCLAWGDGTYGTSSSTTPHRGLFTYTPGTPIQHSYAAGTYTVRISANMTDIAFGGTAVIQSISNAKALGRLSCSRRLALYALGHGIADFGPAQPGDTVTLPKGPILSYEDGTLIID